MRTSSLTRSNTYLLSVQVCTALGNTKTDVTWEVSIILLVNGAIGGYRERTVNLDEQNGK